MLKTIFRIFAFPILAIFILALPLSLVLRDVGSLLFDAETTRTLVRENLLNSELVASLARQGAEQMIIGASQEGQEGDAASTGEEGVLTASAQQALAQLTEEDWRQITELVAPEDLIEQTVDEFVTAFSSWLNNDEPFPNLRVDLASWKANTLENAGEVVTIMLNALPACNEDTVASMALQGAQDPESLTASIPLCLPPEPVYSQLVAQAGSMMGSMLERTPDTIDLQQISQGQDAPPELVQLKANLIQLRAVMSWAWVGVLAIGILFAALAARGFRSFLRWAGWPVLLGGAVTLLLGLSLLVFSFRFLEQLFASNESGAMSVLASAVAGGALNLVSQPLLLQGLVLTTIGLAAVLYARVLARREASPGIPINRRKIGL